MPLVAALGIGLASNIEGRSPLIDGFGLIAFASLFPMITVMLYGVITSMRGVKSDSQLAQSNKIIMPEAKPNLEKKSVVFKDTEKSNALHEKLSLEFNAVVAIIPADKKEIAVEAAKNAGASGVTIIDAEGMGLSKFDNLFRVNHEASDAALIFLLPNHMVDTIIDSIINRLHITTNGDGIVFSFPINQLNGISLRQKDIFQDVETNQ